MSIAVAGIPTWDRSNLAMAPASIVNSYTKVLPPGTACAFYCVCISDFVYDVDVNRRVESLFRTLDVRRVGAIDKQQVRFNASNVTSQPHSAGLPGH